MSGGSEGQGSKQDDDFKVYIKFHIVQSTARKNLSMPSQTASSTTGNSSSTTTGNTATSTKPTDLFRQASTTNTFNVQHTSDIESNKFFVYGLFFMNTGSSDASANRLVFFLFNCAPEHVKQSLIQTQTNTYLIRKPLFAHSSTSSMLYGSTSKIESSSASTTTTSRSSLSTEPYKFYCSRNARKSIQVNPTTSNKNLIKKCFSISEVLINELYGASSASNTNDAYLIYYLNRIEEKCAKYYIKSLIHYLAMNSIVKQPKPVPAQSEEDLQNKVFIE